jgi:hypothetical protein
MTTQHHSDVNLENSTVVWMQRLEPCKVHTIHSLFKFGCLFAATRRKLVQLQLLCGSPEGGVIYIAKHGILIIYVGRIDRTFVLLIEVNPSARQGRIGHYFDFEANLGCKGLDFL